MIRLSPTTSVGRVRVLHVIPDTDRRSSQVFARNLCSAMHALGHEVELVALYRGQQAKGLRVDPLVSGSGRSVKKDLRQRMREVDVTVAHGPVAGEEVAKAAGRKLSFVYRQVRDTRFWRRRPPRPKDMPAYFRRARFVVAMSPGARGDLIDMVGVSGSKVHVIPLGVPSATFHVPSGEERAVARERLGIDRREFVVMTMGVLQPEKGIDFAIRAAIATELVKLVVVGDGPERVRLERLAEGLAPGRVLFAGHTDDPMEMYSAADAVAHPSVSGDSMSAVLIEAGFCGLPVITTPIGSFEHVVEHGVNGLVVPSMDQHGLRAAMEVLRVGRRGRERMGEEARARAIAKFDIDAVAKEWVRVLEPVAAAAAS